MTPDERGLLAAVLESPDDDTPRLVLADWYEENRRGVRARFIRTQIDLARLVAADRLDSDEYVAAMQELARVPDLAFWDGVRRAGFPLAAGLQYPVDVRANEVLVRDVGNSASYLFRRGFLDELLVPAEWVRAYTQAFADNPVRQCELNAGIGPAIVLRFVPPEVPGSWWVAVCAVTWLGRTETFRRHWQTRQHLGANLLDWLHDVWTHQVPEALADFGSFRRELHNPQLENLFAPPP